MKRILRWGAALMILLIGMALSYRYLLLDWENRPFCHKQLWGVFFDHGTNVFPNIDGSGSRSLMSISNEMGGYMAWTTNYNYVPGLREGDPGDLVLLYVNKPTRWTWHGAPPTIFTEKKWIVVPVDFTMGGRDRIGGGEQSERLSDEQFRERLERTLDFLRTNERPNWETVVAENTKVLQSLGD